MSMEVANADGPIDQFASGGGYADLVLEAQAQELPALKALFDKGASTQVPKVIEELETLATNTEDRDVASTAEGLAKMIRDDEEIFITDGQEGSFIAPRQSDSRRGRRSGLPDARGPGERQLLRGLLGLDPRASDLGDPGVRRRRGLRARRTACG